MKALNYQDNVPKIVNGAITKLGERHLHVLLPVTWDINGLVPYLLQVASHISAVIFSSKLQLSRSFVFVIILVHSKQQSNDRTLFLRYTAAVDDDSSKEEC